MPLRPYQAELVDRVSQAWRKGKKSPCIVLPCGGGKSVIVAEIAKKTTLNRKNVLFLVHRKELCDQIFKTFVWWGVDMDYCKIMMVQTACRRLEKLDIPSLIITDENHHSKAESYIKIYNYFPESYRVGVTATPVRLDGSGLKDVNDELIVGVSAKWLIENSCLSPYDYYAPVTADMSEIKVRNGEFDAVSAESVMTERKVYGDVIKYYNKYADGLKTICYCTTIKHSRQMAEKFQKSGIRAVHIDGGTPKTERDRIIENFRTGAIDILCNVDLISEGFDVPDCNCVIMLRPTQSLTLYIQQSMRCMRYKKGKRAVILDHVGNYSRFGMPDDDRQWTLEERKKAEKIISEKQEEQEERLCTCKKCYTVFPASEESCPRCGTSIEKKIRKEIRSDDKAEIQKITGFKVNFQTPDDCRNYSELLKYAENRGYKKGWAYYQAKTRGFIE